IQTLMLLICAIKFKIKVKDEIRKSRLNFLLVISTIFIVIGAVLISLVEGMSIGDALWWSFVTFTTVGYGDILLKTQLGRTIAVLLMIIGIGIIGVITTSLTLYILDDRKSIKKTYRDKVIDDVKSMLDNYDELSNNDIDNIAKILKSLKD
ncbi:MAG: two pore domain potassium channel family protein, partial [Clostridium sp.]|nr:two pore domain potassium channel family protein [Clostridium sp.]